MIDTRIMCTECNSAVEMYRDEHSRKLYVRCACGDAAVNVKIASVLPDRWYP